MIHRISPLRVATLLLVLFIGLSSQGFAQCKDWARLGGSTSDADPSYPQPIAVNGGGTPYILNEEPTTHKATVKKYNGSDWEIVGSAGFSPGSISVEDLKIDNSGTPYVAFADGNASGKVTVMKFNGSSWVTVGSAGFTNLVSDVAFAIDASGTPYVAYADYSDSSKVTVMKFNGSNWVLVGSATFSSVNASWLSIAIDNTTSNPYVAFRDGAYSNGLTVMKYNGSSWAVVGSVNISGAEVEGTSIAISGAGVPYVAYGSNDGSIGLFVKAFDGSSWNAVGGEIFTGAADFCTVLLDASDTPYVGCVSENYSWRPAVMKYNGSSWDMMGSVDLRYSAYRCSFFITGGGIPYMSYHSNLDFVQGIVTRYETIGTTISGSPAVCIGGTTTLTHPQGGGIWSSTVSTVASIGSSTGIVSGVEGGLVPISYTVGNCMATTTVTVSPNTGIITGSRTVNVGSAVTLSNVATGGTWSVSNANATINSSGVLTGITAGTTTVSYTVTGSCGTASDQLLVDVLPAGGSGCRDWVSAGNVGTVPSGTSLYYYKVKMAPDGTAYAMYSVYETYGGMDQSVTIKRFNGSDWVDVGGGVLPYDPGAISGMADMTVDNSGNVYAVGVGYDSTFVYRYSGDYWHKLPKIPVMTSEEMHLAVNTSGTLYVAFEEFTVHKITVLKYNGTGWETVGAPTFSGGVSYNIDGFEVNGTTPYVVYRNYDNDGKIDVMRYNGSSWEYVGGAGVSSYGPYNSWLAITSSGIPYVLYDGTMKKFNGTSWETLPAFHSDFGPSSFVLDQSDVPYVGGTDGSTGDGRVLSYTAGTWHNLGSPGIVSGYSYVNSIAVSNNGDAYMVTSYPGGGVVTAMRHSVRASSLPAITGSSTFCTGGTITLSESATIGSWSSGNTAVATVGSASGVVTAVAGGTATISYSIGSSCTATKVVSNESTAGMITGPMSVQVGHTVTFSDAVSGGTWSVSNGNASISASGVVTGVSDGTVTVSYTVTNSCGSAVETVVVTVSSSSGSCPLWQEVGAANSIGIGGYLASATDASGRAYVAFADSTQDYKAVVKRYNGSEWVQLGGTFSVGSSYVQKLMMGPDGMPYVSYQDMTSPYLAYVKKFNGSTWENVTTDEPTELYESDFTMAPDGTLYRFATETGYSPAIVEKLVGSTWVTVGTSAADDFLFYASIAVGSTGTPYIAYMNSTTDITVRKYNGTAWQDVGTPSIAGGYADDFNLGVYGASTPYLVLKDPSYDQKVSVLKYNGSSWVAVGSRGMSAGVCGIPNIAFDGSGNVYIIYYDAGLDNTVVVSKFNGTSWIPQNISPSTGKGWHDGYATLTIDPSGVPYVGYSTYPGFSVGVRRYDLATTVAPITGSTLVCSGSTITLSEANLGGQWIVSDTTITSIDSVSESKLFLTGVSNGTVTISYVIGSCSATTIVTVTSSGGSAGSITGTATVCAGNTTTLANSIGGGTWISSNTSVATVGSSSGIVTGVTAGNATITYAVATGCGTATATKVVTVNGATSAGTITGTATVCAGSTTTLGNAITGGTWSSGNTSVATIGSSTGIVSGITAGNATITYTVTDACGSATANKVVTVNAAESAGTITGTASVCLGATTTLDNAVTGGVWSSSNTSVATVGSSTGVVSSVTAGNATITYTVAGTCGTATATKVVTVGTSASITGSLALCAGMTSTLSGGASGGTWSSSNTAVATIGASSGILTAVSNGTANITYDLGSGCTATAVVGVSSPASIGGTANVCVGYTTTLTDATTGGTWSSSNTSLATVDASTGEVTGVAAGTVTISYAVSAGCYRTISFIAKANPPVVATPVTVCVGNTASIPPPSTNGYSWTSSNTTVATIGSSSGVLTGLTTGTTTLTYTTITGCYVTTEATVNAVPSITGTTTLCAGGASSLSCSLTGGLWSSSNSTIASVGASTGVVTGVSSGNATITYTTNGCRATTVVSVSPFAAIAGPLSTCLGSTTTLTDATAGGTWSSSNTGIATIGSSTGIVTGVAAGNATITYSAGSGCSRTAVVTVVATPGTISGTLSVCPGSTTTLTGATSGGTWSGGNATIATINSSTGVVSGIGAGTINVSYTLTGCRSTAIATVNPLPASIAGTTNACVAQTATLTNATAGGAWSSNNTSIATVDASTGVVTGVSAATTLMTYTLGTGCYKTVSFTVKALPPAIASPVAACVGTSTSILPPSTNGKSWSSSTTSVATIGSSNGIMTGVSTGTTTLTYTTTTGCFVTTVATVYALPSAGTITGPASVVVGSTITLDDAAGGGVWSSSNARATVGSATGIVTGISGGPVTISYSVSNPGCTVRATQLVSVVTSRPGDVQSAAGRFQLYPNPTTGAFTVEVDEAGVFSIYSLDGREISRHNITTGINQLTLSNELANGIYMCRYTSESGSTTMVRLVYER